MTNLTILLTIIISLVGLLLAAALAAFLIIRRWQKTPHGKLNFVLAVILKMLQNQNTKGWEYTVAARRVRNDGNMRTVGGAPLPVRKIWNVQAPVDPLPIPLRCYRHAHGEKLPVIVYFHGGGWSLGSLEAYDNVCRFLCRKSGALVIAVDYRLAPENPFPAAVEDAYAALLWVAQQAITLGGDPGKLVVCGDSSGGNLAAVVAHLARDRGAPALACQVLLYPVTDVSTFNTPSYRYFKTGYILTCEEMEWFTNQYLPHPADRRNPLASPLLAENVARLPPAIIYTAQFDILRDEGAAYARRLEQAGVPVIYAECKGMMHGFLSMTGILPDLQGIGNRLVKQIQDVLQTGHNSADKKID